MAASIQSSQRQDLILLFCIQIFLFASTFAHLVIVALPDAQTAGAITTIMLSLTMIFNGWASSYNIEVDELKSTGSFNHHKPFQGSGSSCIVSVHWLILSAVSRQLVCPAGQCSVPQARSRSLIHWVAWLVALTFYLIWLKHPANYLIQVPPVNVNIAPCQQQTSFLPCLRFRGAHDGETSVLCGLTLSSTWPWRWHFITP